MNNVNIEIYESLFSRLHTKVENNVMFPHKAILLISIMDLVRNGYLLTNKIYLENTIEEAFEYTWALHMSGEVPNVWTPFWHLNTECFWHFKPVKSFVELERMIKVGKTPSFAKMKTVIEYAYIDNVLFDYFCQSSARTDLYRVLKNVYIDQSKYI